jgi:PAS domain S-box-containing protein
MPDEMAPKDSADVIQAQLEAVEETIDEAVIGETAEGVVSSWNRAAEQIFGYSAQEMVGKPSSILIPPDRSTKESTILSRVKRGERVENYETQRIRRDGSVVDVVVSFFPFRDSLGHVTASLNIIKDLSAHKRLERAEHDQFFLTSLVSFAEDAIISKDLNGIVISWNGGAEKLLGYTAAEMIGKSVARLIPPDRTDEQPQILEGIRRGERIDHYETQRIRKDGQLVNVSLSVSPIRDRMGRIIGASKIVRDLSERDRLLKAERDQLFLASIVSSADDAIISKDLNGIVTSWNSAAERIFGYSAAEMIGQPILRLIPADHANEEPQILERIRRGERIDHYETQRRRKDGSLVDISLSISPIRDRLGHIVGASKIARDITERKRWERAEIAQSFLGALVESADDAIISKTLDGVVTSWNHAAEKLYGYTADEIIGKPMSMLIPADHADEEPQMMDRIRRGERIHHYETQRVRKDGRVLDIALTVSPIKDSLGRVFGVSKIARDITDRKRGEIRERNALREAQEAKQAAEEANRAKDEFLATVSHELRTPMTAILGWTRMLLSGQLNQETHHRAIETIDRNAKAQAQLIEDLLDVSRIVSGKLRIDFKVVELPAVIAAAVEAVRPMAEAKRIQIQTVLSAGTDPILGDSQRLQQVIWNLLSNAIRFTPADGLVRVELQRIESQIQLQVIDNGMGIKPEFLPHIFDRFTQADSSITRNYGGLGMGLSIVKSLVEFHGGVVSATSPGEGLGAVFTVKLPVSAVRHDSAHQSGLQIPWLQTGLEDRHELVGMKILVVDDEADACELLRFIFNECGAIVESATNATQALQLFDNWKPDILVSDIGMPEIDGYDLIRSVRNERHSRIPAVALTAMARIEDRVKALNAGYQMHVAKPIEPVELVTIVSSLVSLVNRRPRT